MRNNHIISCTVLAALLITGATSCKKDYGNLNRPIVEDVTHNASKDQLNNLVTGTESGMRTYMGSYLDNGGMIGREMYHFSSAEPRYVQDLLGGGNAVLNNNTFYITRPWAARYQVVKNANILIQAANNSSLVTAEEKKGYSGFAKTIKAYELLLNLNLTYNNGIRTNVTDPDNLGPIVNKDQALTDIATMLDDGKADLTGASVVFSLSSGFAGLDDAAGLLKLNRAIAARVAVYRKQWTTALTALNESFFNINGSFTTGAYHVFSTGSGDQLNPAFFPQNQSGEVRVAHPSYAADIEPGDDRIGKATLRTVAASQGGLTSNRDVWVYTSSTAPMPIIRNEELILIYAEAKIQLNALPDAIVALNVIRTKHNLPPYAGAVSQAALITEMLKQRRYSLFYEGHRWVDIRRYNLLNTLPIDRPGDDVWTEFPLPLTEQ